MVGGSGCGEGNDDRMVVKSRKREKKRKKYYKELTADILNDEYCVHIFLGDAAKACKALKKWYPDICGFETLGDSRGYTFTNANTNPSVWVGLELDDCHFYATLAHEAVHAIDHIFSMIQEKNAPEIYAHCVGAVVAKVEQWSKQPKKERV